MCSRRSLWYKLIVLALALVLVVPILMACGGDNDKENTATPEVTQSPTSTATPEATSTATTAVTATPAINKEQVKIGAIYPKSGQFAVVGILYDPILNLVEEQVKNQGGILGGRQVKFIIGDDRGVVAEAAAQAKKLILEEKVSMLTFGGVSVASFDAVAAVAEELKVPYVALAGITNMATKKYCADLVGWQTNLTVSVPHIEYLKPKSIAFLGYDLSDIHYMLDGREGIKGIREQVKAMGIDIVYEQYYPLDTVDFSSYLTKIKYLNPDLLYVWVNDIGQEITIQKQIMEQGGYGNMKYYCAAPAGSSPSVTKRSASWGTYTMIQWLPGSSEPGMKAFEDAYVQKFSKQPDAQVAIGYNCFWIAIKAIELAGTDNPEKVAQALRSGKLEWDSAFGPLHIDSNGEGIMQYGMAQIKDGGKLVQVWP